MAKRTNTHAAETPFAPIPKSLLEGNRRDRLISDMLRDRGVLRLLSAPSGYGKSALAAEYAARLFSRSSTLWLEASKPQFLKALDTDSLALVCEEREPKLLIIDSVPYLDEQRAQKLSEVLDRLLYSGIEVVVTCVPSNDTLRNLQPDRILIQGRALEVTRSDVTALIGDESEASTALADWSAASDTIFGHIPAVFWNGGEQDVCRPLAAFFSERLPMEVHRAAFAMILLGKGTVGELDGFGLGLREEMLRLLIDDYPFLNLDGLGGSFSIPPVSFAELSEVLKRCDVADFILDGRLSIPEKVLKHLLGRGDTERVSAILDAFCSDDRAIEWLRSSGWELIDRGEITLVSALLERCDEATFSLDVQLQLLQAWVSGLSGDAVEALYYAEKATRLNEGARVDDTQTDIFGLAAYIARLAFGGRGASLKEKPHFSNVIGVRDPLGLITAVVDLCTEEELYAALGVLGPDGLIPAPHGSELDEQRAVAFENLLTSCSHMSNHPLFSYALHLVHSVRSARLYTIVRDLGCGRILAARRQGLTRMGDAFLMSDLWQEGFFGVAGQTDTRDLKLFEQASHLLSTVQSRAGHEAVGGPWDARAPQVARIAAPPANRKSPQTADIPVLHVSLFGGFSVVQADKPLQTKTWRSKGRRMFALLVMNRGRDMARDELLSQLWPHSDRTHALDSFYNVWSRITATLASDGYLERNGEFIRVNTALVDSDTAEFERLVRRALSERSDLGMMLDVCARVENVYSGELLPSEPDDAPIGPLRERYRSMYVDTMLYASESALDAGDTRVALWFASRAITVDSAREDVYKTMMEAQMAAGQRCSAIRTYFDCRDVLRESLGLDPSMEMKKLYERLITVDPGLLKLAGSFMR